MKNVFAALFLISTGFLSAADLIVQQNGPVGTYSTITSAVAAANDGDQILINNRTDLLPWQENITVNKSLSFLRAVDNVKFALVSI